MKMKQKNAMASIATVCVLTTALLVAGHPEPVVAQAAPASSNPCHTAISAIGGAVVGGLLGKLTHKGVLKGAAVGGAVGALACVAINYQSHRTQSAQQIQQANPQVQPSPQVTVTNYRMQVQPGNVQAGQTVTVATDIGVLAGSQQSVQTLTVHYDLLDNRGTVQKSQDMPVSGVSPDGGGYQSMLSFSPPSGVPRGTYTVRTSLFVNGQQEGQQQATYVVI
jgi:hypothetical protein